MPPPARRLLVPGVFSGAFLLILLNGWFAVHAVNVLLSSEAWVEHTWQVLAQVELIMSSVKDAETSVRGFIITNKPTYLDTYQVAVRQLPDEFDTLAALTKDNAAQTPHIAALRAAVNQRLGTLQRNADARRSHPELLEGYIQSGLGKQQMDELRRQANTLESEERRLLTERVALTRRASREAHVTVILASILDLLLLVFMFRYLLRERDLRVASELAAENLAIARNAAEQSANEIRLLNNSLEERVQQRTLELETTNRELEAFSYSVSHDLRAPLRTIDGFSLALEEDYGDLVDDTGKDYIARVRSGVQRMGQLIDALLQLSRITRAEITREAIDVSALAASVAADIEEQYKDHAVVIDVEPNLHAEADPRLLRVALENLFGNAAKFSSKVDTPRIRFGWDRSHNAFFIADNGAGFDMLYAGKLFNAFNRLHGDKDFKGSGIGLATVARVIRRHHGTIWAEAEVGHGATFWFTLR